MAIENTTASNELRLVMSVAACEWRAGTLRRSCCAHRSLSTCAPALTGTSGVRGSRHRWRKLDTRARLRIEQLDAARVQTDGDARDPSGMGVAWVGHRRTEKLQMQL